LPMRFRGGCYQIRVPRTGMTPIWAKLLPGTSEVVAKEKRADWLGRLDRGEKIVVDGLRGESPVRPDATIAQIAPHWCKAVDDTKAEPATKRDKVQVFMQLLVPQLGHCRPVELQDRSKLARAWVQWLIGRGGSDSRVRAAYYAACDFYDDIIADEWVPGLVANPMRHLRVKELVPKQRPSKKVRTFALVVLARLVEAPTTPDERAFKWLLEGLQGLDDGEAHGLLFSDFQVMDGITVVMVDENFATCGPEGFASAKGPKREARHKAVPLHHVVEAAYEHYRDVVWPALMGRKPEPTDPVFPKHARGGGYVAERWRPKSADDLRADLAADHLPTQQDGVDVDTHWLRHTLETELRHGRVDPAERDRLMRHAARGTGSRFYDAVDEDWTALKKAIDQIPFGLPERFQAAPAARVRVLVHSEPERATESPPGRGRQSSPISSPEGVPEAHVIEKIQQSQVLGHPSSGVEQRFRKP
jgi:hypothetical protein